MKTTMKAVICPKYGAPEVLQHTKVSIPVPKDDELLIEIKATAVTNSDIFIRSSNLPFPIVVPFRLMMGITRPRKPIIGLVYSGVVKSAGKNTTRFSVGDEVYGMTGFSLGAYAEYTCVKETDSTAGSIALKPKNSSFTEATSAVYGGSLAVQYMDKGNITPGQKVLIYGASGTSGTIAVQYGKMLGAHVTAVCSGRNSAFVQSLGADVVLDYTATDSLPENSSFDFMLDSVGKYKSSELKKACRRALTQKGNYVSIDDGNLELNSKRLDYLRELIEAEKITPLVGKTYSLDDIVEAHRFVETGHKRGGVAITVRE